MAGDVVYIDVADGTKRVMNNTKLYVKFLSKFKEDPSFSEIEPALTEGNTEKAQSCTHTLKGLAANLSLMELFKQSLELETQIKTNTVNPDQIEILKNTYEQTLIEIGKVVEQNA